MLGIRTSILVLFLAAPVLGQALVTLEGPATAGAGAAFSVEVRADLPTPVLGWGLDLAVSNEAVATITTPPTVGPQWIDAPARDGDGLAAVAFPQPISGTHVLLAVVQLQAQSSGTVVLTLAADEDGSTEGFPHAESGFASIAFGPPLSITVLEAGCPGGTAAECADLNGNNVRDDPCLWWDCVAGACDGSETPYPSDMGGTFGACPADQFCNIHDRTHALRCFAGTNSCARINIDAGGSFGTCTPDGFCNIHDANHALICFAGTSSCSCGPAPDPPSSPPVAGKTVLSLDADRRAIKAGAAVRVRVSADDALERLQSYQLHLAATGGDRGALVLESVALDGDRRTAFAGRLDVFSAVNTDRQQLLAGIPDDGIPTRRNALLATLTYRASHDAAGTFVIDVLHDGGAGDQTFLISAFTREIQVTGTRPALVTVASDKGGRE